MKTDAVGVKYPSLLAAGDEVDMQFEESFTCEIENGRKLELPGGRLLVSGPKVSYLPSSGRTVLGYKDDGQRVTKYYVDGEKVAKEKFFQTRQAMGLAHSGFGDGIIPNIRSLRDRKAARFLTEAEAGRSLSEEPKLYGQDNPAEATKEFETIETIADDDPRWNGISEGAKKLLKPWNIVPCSEGDGDGENFIIFSRETFKTRNVNRKSSDDAKRAYLIEILNSINDGNRQLLDQAIKVCSKEFSEFSEGRKIWASDLLISMLKLINKDNINHYKKFFDESGVTFESLHEKILPDFIIPMLNNKEFFVVEDGVVKMDEGLQCCFNVYLSENNERVVLLASQNVEVMSIEKYMRDSLGVRVSFADNLELAKACEKILTTMVRSGHKVPPMILLARNTVKSDELASCDVLKIVNPEHKHLSVDTLEANLSDALIEQIAKKEPKLSGMKMSEVLWVPMIDYLITAEGLIKEDAADAYKAALEKDDETSEAIKADDLIYYEYDKDGTDFIQGVFSKLVIGLPVEARVVTVFQSMVNISLEEINKIKEIYRNVCAETKPKTDEKE